MAIVVSDTSPLRALNHLGILNVLEQLYGTVYMPDAVADELRRSGRLFPALEPRNLPIVRIESPQDASRVKQVQSRKLDPGEAAAIVLALEKKCGPSPNR